MAFVADNWVAILIFLVILYLMGKYAIKVMDAKQERNNDKRIKNILENLEKESKELGNPPKFPK